MLFNSYEYIFVFLPFTVCFYFLLQHRGYPAAAKGFLTLASLFFYGWWNPIYLPLLLALIIFNYLVGQIILAAANPNIKKTALIVGIGVDLLALGYFKYAHFFVQNIDDAFGKDFPLPEIALPLAISFFTFQKIAYLVDMYRGVITGLKFIDYALFVSFFPQLIAGPITHYKEVMPQFMAEKNRHMHFENIARGLILFSIGLFKKVIIADKLAAFATVGFTHPDTLNVIHAWETSLAYTFQIYFDFSGYSDMALGAALLMNIHLPINFNSPYRAKNIQEFWQRWHITLSHFLRDYVYFPLGGSQRGAGRTYLNLLIVFFICGLWHGASWLFVLWGMLHGVAMAIHRMWRNAGKSMHPILGWALTFLFVNFNWVFFRAGTLNDALTIIKKMMFAGLPRMADPALHTNYGHLLSLLIASAAIALLFKNSMQRTKEFAPTMLTLLVAYGLAIVALSGLNHYTEFLYFNF